MLQDFGSSSYGEIRIAVLVALHCSAALPQALLNVDRALLLVLRGEAQKEKGKEKENGQALVLDALLPDGHSSPDSNG